MGMAEYTENPKLNEKSLIYVEAYQSRLLKLMKRQTTDGKSGFLPELRLRFAGMTEPRLISIV